MNVYVSSSSRKLEGFDEVMKEVKFKSLKDPEGFTKGFWKWKLSNPIKDLQNLRRVAEKVPNSRYPPIGGYPCVRPPYESPYVNFNASH